MEQLAYNGAVVEALRLKGGEVLLNAQVFCACLVDLAGPEYARDMQVIRRNVDDAMLRLLYDAAQESPAQLRVARGNLAYLLQEALVVEDAAQRIATALAQGACRYAFGCDLGLEQGKCSAVAQNGGRGASANATDAAPSPAPSSADAPSAGVQGAKLHVVISSGADPLIAIEGRKVRLSQADEFDLNALADGFDEAEVRQAAAACGYPLNSTLDLQRWDKSQLQSLAIKLIGIYRQRHPQQAEDAPGQAGAPKGPAAPAAAVPNDAAKPSPRASREAQPSVAGGNPAAAPSAAPTRSSRAPQPSKTTSKRAAQSFPSAAQPTKTPVQTGYSAADEALRQADDAYYGRGRRKNYSAAFLLYNDAANLGSAAAMGKLAQMHYWGRGTAKNHERALEFASKAPALSSMDAEEILARCAYFGHGMERDYAQARDHLGNLRQAKRIWPNAAPLPSALEVFVCTTLGGLLRDGKGGPQDAPTAEACFKRAYDLGYLAAEYDLADLYYRTGRFDEAQARLRSFLDMAESVHAGTMAASFVSVIKSRVPKAHYLRGLMLAVGQGCQANVDVAFAELQTAAEAGYRPAERALKRLVSGEMPAEPRLGDSADTILGVSTEGHNVARPTTKGPQGLFDKRR